MAQNAAYQAALEYLLSFTDFERGVAFANSPERFDLRRTERLLSLLGNPHQVVPAVHVAGTKGKGSTAAMIASALRATGYRTGLFISPHLHDFRERISVDGQLISEEDLIAGVEQVRPAVEQLAREGVYHSPSTFEVLTALAFSYFARAGLDFQVLEVGLGGRLDATNVVRPLVAVITSISLDHVDILGNSLAQIACEKAGIAKAGVPVVSAPQAPEALAVIEERCRELRSSLLLVGRDVTWQGEESIWGADDGQRFRVKGRLAEYEVWLPLLGAHQRENAAVAVAALECLGDCGYTLAPDVVVAGLARVSWPGRLQVLGRRPLVVADGAHNADSARRLRIALQQLFPSRRLLLVLGTSAGHDVGGIVRELAPGLSRAIATRSRHPRSVDPARLVAALADEGVPVETAEDVPQALDRALRLADPEDLVCAAGSLFVAAEAIEWGRAWSAAGVR